MSTEKTGPKRLRPTTDTTRELYLYSGNQCALPDCTKPLLKNNKTWNCNVAHIFGVKPSSARGHHDLSDEQLRQPSNLLLVCTEHHLDIDNKELESKYTVQVLQDIKTKHEGRYRQAIAGLERIIDTSLDSTIRYPINLGKLESIDDDGTDRIAKYLDDMRPWIDAIKRQPLGIRDLIVLILNHGKQGRGRKSDNIYVKWTQIEGVANLGSEELKKRVLHLMDEKLIAYEDDFVAELVLQDPTTKDIGWNLFTDLYSLGLIDNGVYYRAIIELDFTVFDQ